jgi:hypothetical protein
MDNASIGGTARDNRDDFVEMEKLTRLVLERDSQLND